MKGALHQNQAANEDPFQRTHTKGHKSFLQTQNTIDTLLKCVRHKKEQAATPAWHNSDPFSLAKK